MEGKWWRKRERRWVELEELKRITFDFFLFLFFILKWGTIRCTWGTMSSSPYFILFYFINILDHLFYQLLG